MSWDELVFGAEHSQQTERNLADIEAMITRLEVLSFDNKAHINSDKYVQHDIV